MKFCKHCGEQIDDDCVVCPKCGKQVEELKSAKESPVVIQNTVNATAISGLGLADKGTPKNKWVALILCFFLGCLGVHKFYEGKVLMGIIYFFTLGLFCIGVIIDFIVLLFKPNPYYV